MPVNNIKVGYRHDMENKLLRVLFSSSQSERELIAFARLVLSASKKRRKTNKSALTQMSVHNIC